MQQLKQTIVHLFHPRRSNNHRPRVLHNDSLGVFVAILIGFSFFSLVTPRVNPKMGYILGYATDITVQTVVEQTNAQRNSVGLAPLTLNAELSNAAASKAQDMFANQYWAHTSPSGKEPWAFISGAGYSYVAAGENLARDFLHTNDMMAAWMASPTHKANIVNTKYEEIGVAVVDGTLDGIETTLVVQMFGKPQANTSQLASIPQQAKAVEETNDKQELEKDMNSSPAPAVNQESSVIDQPIFKIEQVLALTDDANETPEASYLSPLHLVKAFGLAILILLMGALIYDMIVMHNQPKARFVGKNTAHLLFFLAVSFVVLIFKSGFIG